MQTIMQNAAKRGSIVVNDTGQEASLVYWPANKSICRVKIPPRRYEDWPKNTTKLKSEMTYPSVTIPFPVIPVLASSIALRPDLMQFKRIDDPAHGTNAEDEIKGAWDNIKAGNMLLWEPVNRDEFNLVNGFRYILVNGHHRYLFGMDQKVEFFNAQILRESDGFSQVMARMRGAEANIADGKGTIFDQARYIRDMMLLEGRDAALVRAKAIGTRARRASAIAINSEDDLYISFINEQITAEQTEAIANAAPHDETNQRLGILQAVKGMVPPNLYNFIQAVKFTTGCQADQSDLFGSNDAAIAQAEQLASRAANYQKGISEQIRAVQGAARRPELARKLGVDITDPQGVLNRVAQLKGDLERWNNWPVHPDLVNTLRIAA